MQPHEPALRAYLRSYFPSSADIDEVVQETHLRLIKAARQGRIRSAKAYLFATARNLAFSVFRRPRIFSDCPVTDFTVSSIPASDADVADAVCAREETALLLEAVDHLPARCREIFIMLKLRRMSHQEVADHLGLSVETVHTQCVRGLRKCAAYLESRGVVR